MLTIKNIGDLIGAQLNDWKVLTAGVDNRPELGKNYLYHYIR